MKVVIRVDASSTIGIGHLTRCLALTEALSDLGAEVVLATTKDTASLTAGWRREGAAVEVLDTAAGSHADAEATSRLVVAAGATWLCIDGYGFGSAYHGVARGTARVAIVDDLGADCVDADLVINGNLYAVEAMYPGTRARLLVGPRYALLRREFRKGSAAPRPRSGVVVSLGGADPDARTEPLLVALTEVGVRGTVIVGPRQAAAPALRDRAARLGWNAVEAPTTMADHLRACELAVIGAGTTTLEALALGTPMVAVRIAENQRRAAEALARAGLAVIVEGAEPMVAAREVVALLSNRHERSEMAERARGTVDGLGALRAAEAMREPLIRLRPATHDDAELLFAWRNDPVTRAASFDTQIVPRAAHLTWMRHSLKSGDRFIRIAELDDRAIGVIRLDRVRDAATLSITLAPEVRGKRLAATLLRHAIRDATDLGIGRIDAMIRSSNAASRRAFTAAGFAERPISSDQPDVVTMTMDLPVAR